MTQAVVPLHDRDLSVDSTNSVFIRAWYSSNQYAIFKSPGITAAPQRITTTTSAGVEVKDLKQSADTKDTDYIASTSTVHMRWDSLFQAGTAGIEKFKVYISRTPAGHDIYTSGFINSPTTTHSATGLSLLENTRYYTNVLVYNHAGIVSYDTSDGFIVDVTAPDNGIVLDGSELRDIDYQSKDTQVKAQWKHFSDKGSGIHRYWWCVSTVNDLSDCNTVSWTDMGLRTHGVLYASISSGTTVYNKIKAEDWAGNQSPVSKSDGVTIDTSGPTPANTIYISESELIQNPSFEDDTYSFDNSTACDVGDPASWTLSTVGCVKLQMSSAPIAAHDSHYVLMSGELSQTVSVTTSALYRLQIKVGYPQALEYQHKVIDGYVSLGLDSHSFHLDPDRCQGQCGIETEDSILWYTFSFYHTPVSSSLAVVIGTRHYTSDMRLALDEVRLRRVYYSQQYGGQPTENYVSHHVMFLPRWSTINALWHFEDSQSIIVDYMWAIGTVPGGTQLQNFISVGKLNHGVASGLSLNHNSTVHVTVVATNAAGVSTKVEFDPIVVDMTAPVIYNLNDGTGPDKDYQTEYTISANWEIYDNESNPDYCVWAIGTKPGKYDVKIFETLSQGIFYASHLVDNNTYPAPFTFYTTVRCYNDLGLFSVAYTNGVTVVSAARQDGISSTKMLKDSSTYRTITDQCVTTPDTLRLKWDLEQTDTLIKAYKFSIRDVTPVPPIPVVYNCTDNSTLDNSTLGNNTSGNITGLNSTNDNCTFTEWVPSNFSVYDRNTTDEWSPDRDFPPFSASLYGMPLSNSSNISVSIIPIDIFDTERDGSEMFIMVNPPGPSVTGGMMTETNLTTSSTNLTLNWSNVFSSYWTDLTFEVTVGSKQGASNIIQWQETNDTSLVLDMANAEIRTFNLSVIITAYDACGYFSTYDSGLFMVYLPES